MSLRVRPLLIVLALTLFAVSFALTISARSQAPQPTLSQLGSWLGLDAKADATIRSKDPGFADDVASLKSNLNQERTKLASLFEDASVTDEALLQQVEVVIEVHNKLERRVAAHIIAVRDILDPEQQKRLFRLCADGVRESRQQRWRHRGGRGDGAHGHRGQGRGHGRGNMRGGHQGQDD